MYWRLYLSLLRTVRLFVMSKGIRDFHVGRPQVLAGLLLAAFFAQCLWVSANRKLSDLEYEYIASGLHASDGQPRPATSPFTSLASSVSLHLLSELRKVVPSLGSSMWTYPRPWLIRMPFAVFGLWLGGALWWVARRLFGDGGGYVALALYCISPAMIEIGSNAGPEIVLAWSIFGLIYTAIGVAHTVYAPPGKWIPRIALLGVAIGICLSTALWSFTVVLFALILMLYLSTGRRSVILMILLGATLIGVIILLGARGLVGSHGWELGSAVVPTQAALNSLAFAFADSGHWLYLDFVVPVLLAAALTVYGSWKRTRYFGNTAPLISSFTIPLLFALVPGMRLWQASLGLSFLFLFIGGIAADIFETSARRVLSFVLFAILAIKGVLSLGLLRAWIHQNPI